MTKRWINEPFTQFYFALLVFGIGSAALGFVIGRYTH